MLLGIIAFEWRYATRRLTFAAAAATFALLAFALTSTGFGAVETPVNAPYAITYTVGFLTLLSVFAVTVLVAPSLLRDTEHQMAELIYATAVTRTRYLLGRFVGSFLAAATAFAFALPGMLAATLRHPPERVAPFDLLHYLWPFFGLALPSMLFVAALLFTVAALTRSSLVTYLAGVCLYALYFLAAVVTNSPLLAASRPSTAEELIWSARVDPFGLSAFFEQTHHWTAAERAVQSFSWSGEFLLNRLIWLAVAAALLALAHRRFAFRVSLSRPRAEAAETRFEVGPGPERDGLTSTGGRAAAGSPGTGCAAYHPTAVRSGHSWRLLGSTARVELGAVFRSWPFAALMILWVGASALQIIENLRRGEFGTALYPTSGLILGHLQQPLMIFGLLLVIFFGAELVWRERTTRVSEIVDATAASSVVFLGGKLVALWTLVAVLIATSLGVALTIQLSTGYDRIEPGVLAALFYFGGVPLALFAVLVLLFQTLVPNRHAGMMVSLAAAALLTLGIPGSPEHPLLRYANGGPLSYSEFDGFGPGAWVFTAFMAYWSALAAVLGMVSYGLWRRGTDGGLRARLAALPRRWGRSGALLAAGLALVFLGGGAVLFHQVETVNGYQGSEERTAWRADYERTYASVASLPQPTLAHLEARLDLHPQERRFQLEGTYRLENRTAQVLTSVIATFRPEVEVQSVTVGGRPPLRHDSRFGVRTFEVHLLPGASTELAFQLSVQRQGATANVQHDILPNGTLLLGHRLLPTLGYRRGLELDDPIGRSQRGLPVKSTAPEEDPVPLTFDLTISTPSDQVPVTAGVLRQTWLQDGRRIARFAVDHPVAPALFFASARYQVQRTHHQGVEIEILHHPLHGTNVPRILEATTRSLDYFTTHFGPYPFPQLRLAEVPAYDDRFGGFALPATILLTEDRAFLTDLRDPDRVDIVTKRTAHEVAHQWWGHQVTPAAGPGASAVVETLARYSELMVLKESAGEAALREALKVELGRYLSGRTQQQDVPLVEVEDQSFVYYAKGALVMAALRDLIGEAEVNRALRALLAQAKGSGPAPTARDLLAHLSQVTPPEHRPLLEEWWTRTVLYDLRVVSATSTPLSDGRFRIEAALHADKIELRDGREVRLPMDETLELALYDEHPDRGGVPGKTWTQRLGGDTRLELIADQPPGYLVIDPQLRRIDRKPEDNARKISP